MGALPSDLAASLRDALGLRRGIETGTLHGGGARLMGELFDSAASIELSPELHAAASAELAGAPNVEILLGDSREVLPTLVDPEVPTLFFLDGHWSGGETAGEEFECPVLGEVAALTPGHRDDCVVIDDARLFTASPPPPHDPEKWPTIAELFDALRTAKPGHHVTVLQDVVVAVPASVKPIVDEWGRQPPPEPSDGPQPGLLWRLRCSLQRDS